MTTNQSIENATAKTQAEGRGVSLLMSILAGVLFAIGLLGFLFLPGCATFESMGGMEALDKLAEKWKDKLEQSKPEIPPETPPTKPEPDKPIVGDAVAFSSLQWQYGGMKAGGAVLSTPKLSNASCNGRVYYYRWDVGLSGWGLGNGDAGAVCAVFIERDGQWVGGKFDWVSTSRTFRGLDHLESYSTWPDAKITLPLSGRVAFVVTSADGKRRSNVIMTEVK